MVLSEIRRKHDRKQQKKTRGKFFVFIFTLIFIFIMSNNENRTEIAAEETVDTDSSKHIPKHLKNSEGSKKN